MESEVGKRIKMIRLELGMSGKEFGQQFQPHASDSIVSRWERGVNLPNARRIKRISELGNITVDELLKEVKENE